MQIIEYTEQYKDQVIALILEIQRNEFQLDITAADQPDLHAIEDFYVRGGGNFWLAVMDSQVVGTISLVSLNRHGFALRKMFVQREFRGRGHAAARMLLDTAEQWVAASAHKDIYLGTTVKFLAAHKFYRKHGFQDIAQQDLPDEFPVMQVDTIFFKKSL